VHGYHFAPSSGSMLHSDQLHLHGIIQLHHLEHRIDVVHTCRSIVTKTDFLRRRSTWLTNSKGTHAPRDNSDKTDTKSEPVLFPFIMYS
jgi:hypothetical protein